MKRAYALVTEISRRARAVGRARSREGSSGELPPPDHKPDREAPRPDAARPRVLRDYAADAPGVRSPDPPDRAVLALDPRLGAGKPEADHPRHMGSEEQ